MLRTKEELSFLSNAEFRKKTGVNMRIMPLDRNRGGAISVKRTFSQKNRHKYANYAVRQKFTDEALKKVLRAHAGIVSV